MAFTHQTDELFLLVAVAWGGLMVGGALSCLVPVRYIRSLWPATVRPVSVPPPPIVPEIALPPVHPPAAGEPIGTLGVLLGGIVLLGILGALGRDARKDSEP